MITGWVYAALWFVIAGYFFYLAVRESRFFFFIAPFFVFLGAWALADELMAADLMGGVFGWIYRGVGVVALVICLVKYFTLKRKR